MINLLLAAAVVTPSPLTVTQVAMIKPYLDCFKPIVEENEARAERYYLPFEKMFQDVKQQCASSRLVARDVLAAHVAAQILRLDGRRPPDNDEWKEELIDDATIKWMSRGFGSGEAK